MADVKFSELTTLAAADVATDDIFAVVDTSATTSKKLTVANLLGQVPSGAPLHIHDNEEIIFVINGTIKVTIEKEIINLKEGQIVLVPQKTKHSLKNENKEDAKIAIIFATNNPFSKTQYLK